jgi:HK97 family phage portal protein
MDLFGLRITRLTEKQLAPVESRGGWWPLIRESYSGAWQRNDEIRLTDVLSHPTVFACITLIASDIAKMRLRLVELDENGIWSETDSASFSPVLRKPNRFQTRIGFIKSWVISKLAHGNTYVLKQRDNRGGPNRGVVTAMYILDPQRVRVLVAPDGGVYYELKRDDLSSQPQQQIVVPASEMIHDVMYPLYHPLVGVGPIHACGLAATLGLQIQTNSSRFFTNQSSPSGMLTAPAAIGTETAERLKADFETRFAGENIGKLLVAGDGLTFVPFTMTAVDAQLSEQWRGASEAICSAFKVPRFKVGVGPDPSFNNGEMIDRQYYSQCLQELIETIEVLLDEGLGLNEKIDGRLLGTEFDLDDLLRMDTSTMMTTLAVGTGAGILSPNEARLKINQKPVTGGDVPVLQQQYWPLDQLAKRDTPGIPAAPPRAELPPAPDEDDEDDELAEADITASIGPLLTKALELHP